MVIQWSYHYYQEHFHYAPHNMSELDYSLRLLNCNNCVIVYLIIFLVGTFLKMLETAHLNFKKIKYFEGRMPPGTRDGSTW